MSMQNDVSHTVVSSPLAGVVVAAVGVAGYAWTTAIRVFDGAATLAQAAAPSVSLSWDSITQTVTAVLAILGGVSAWISVQRQKAHTDAIERRKLEADADRDIWLRDQLAKLTVQQVAQHADVREHLKRQDEALAAVQQALPTTGEMGRGGEAS